VYRVTFFTLFHNTKYPDLFSIQHIILFTKLLKYDIMYLKDNKRKEKTMKYWFERQENIQQVIELYKCHYTAKEIAEKTGKPYHSIITLIRGFKVASITKYNRSQLSPILQSSKEECYDATETKCA